jgi:hypothetical protein
MDHQGLPPANLLFAADADHVAPAMRDLLKQERRVARPVLAEALPAPPPLGSRLLDVPALAMALRRAVGDRPVSLLHLPLSWDGLPGLFGTCLITWVPTVAAGLGPTPASRWAPRLGCGGLAGCRSLRVAMATS